MLLSDCEVRDPRMRRTRRLLQGALATLMKAKRFDEIAVQDITELATVNRATFYDHYTDKYALLEAMVAGGFHTLLHERQVRYDGTCPSAASAVILATCDYLRQSHAGGDRRRQSAFEPLIDAAMTSAIGRVLMEGMPGHHVAGHTLPHVAGRSAAHVANRPAGRSASRADSRSRSASRTASRPTPEMIATAAGWAIYGAVKTWFHTPNRPPAEEAVPHILELVMPILEAGLSRDRRPAAAHS